MITEAEVHKNLENKTKRIINALKRGERLSQMDMARGYNYWRGSDLVFKAKKRGLDIKTDIVYATVNGKTSKRAVYYIES